MSRTHQTILFALLCVAGLVDGFLADSVVGRWWHTQPPPVAVQAAHPIDLPAE